MDEFRSHPVYTSYECNAEGKLRNKDTGKFITPKPDKEGYVRFRLTKKYDSKPMQFHRMIAEIWYSNDQNKPTVNHINKIRNDNRPCNLEFATFAEQAIHQNAVDKPVRQFYVKTLRKTNNNVVEYNTCKEAAIDILTQQKAQLSEKYINMVRKKIGVAIKNNTLYMQSFWAYESIEDLPDEIWKLITIEGNTKSYVSNMGRVKYNERLCSTNSKSNGYVRVSINSVKHSVHRLVALAFIPNDDPTKDQVNHIDGDIQNNTVSNLEWLNQSDNIRHAVMNNPLIKPVNQVDHIGNIIQHFLSADHAAKTFKIDHRKVKECCMQGVSYKGLYFRYDIDHTDDNVNFENTSPEVSNTTGRPMATQADFYKNLIKTCDEVGTRTPTGSYIIYFDEATNTILTIKTTRCNQQFTNTPLMQANVPVIQPVVQPVVQPKIIKKIADRVMHAPPAVKPAQPVVPVQPIIKPPILPKPAVPAVQPVKGKSVQHPTIQYKDNTIIKFFESQAKACKALRISHHPIKHCCTGKMVSFNGMYFKYYDPATDDLTTMKIK